MCTIAYHVKCLPQDGLCPECGTATARQDQVWGRAKLPVPCQRPTSVTVICWLLVISGICSALSGIVGLNNPMARELMSKSPIPISAQIAMLYVGSAICVACGSAMLRGCKWARTLYIGWSIIGFAIGFATSPMKLMLMPGLAFLALIVFFLTRPAAQQFFSGAQG